MTFSRDAAEDKLLRESLALLAAYKMPVYITDGGSPDSFLQFLQGFPQFKVVQAQKKGLMAQVSSSLAAASASEKPFILYTEPDKKFFFQALPTFLEQVPPEAPGIFLASRSAVGFGSYPSFQQMTETCVNNCCTEATGHFLDYTYGPFLMHRRLAPCMAPVQEDIGWGWRPYVFVTAKRLGLQLAEYRDDYLCPPEQQSDSAAERLYRMRQLEQSVRGIVLATGAPLEW